MPFMKPVQVSAPGADFELVQKEVPDPEEHEVLLKVEACGVCHGDAIVKQGITPGCSIRGRPVMRLLEPSPNLVRSHIIGMSGKESEWDGVVDTVTAAIHA